MVAQGEVYSENVQKFQTEYRLQLHTTAILMETRHSFLFRS